jgi:adenylosuccinate synthase
LEGELTSTFPLDLPDVDNIRPKYKTMPGWQQSLASCNSFEDLPDEAKNYLQFVQEYLGVELTYLSKGPKRSETIKV